MVWFVVYWDIADLCAVCSVPDTMYQYCYWVLGTGYWVVGTGYWVLGTGYWVLGTGYWVLGAAMRAVSCVLRATHVNRTNYIFIIY